MSLCFDYNISNNSSNIDDIFQNPSRLDFDNLYIINDNKSPNEFDFFNRINLDSFDDPLKLDEGNMFLIHECANTMLTTKIETKSNKNNEVIHEISENNEVTSKSHQINAFKLYEKKVPSKEHYKIDIPYFLGKKRYHNEDDDLKNLEIFSFKSILMNPMDESYINSSEFHENFREKTTSQNNEFYVSLEELDMDQKRKKIFKISKKPKFLEIGKLNTQSFDSSTTENLSLEENPNDKIINSRKFADDSMNKKNKTSCFKCLSEKTATYGLYNQNLITNVTIIDNKELNEKPVRNIIDESFEKKYAKVDNALKIARKKELDKSLESKQEYLELTFGQFYESVYLKSDELKKKLEKIKEKESSIYYEKYVFRVKTYISYFENNKGNIKNKSLEKTSKVKQIKKEQKKSN